MGGSLVDESLYLLSVQVPIGKDCIFGDYELGAKTVQDDGVGGVKSLGYSRAIGVDVGLWAAASGTCHELQGDK